MGFEGSGAAPGEQDAARRTAAPAVARNASLEKVMDQRKAEPEVSFPALCCKVKEDRGG